MPTQDSRRKSKFKDIAGDLVSRDREARKNPYFGFNLGQAIASHLEKAYQMGLKAQSQTPSDTELPLQYCDIPRRFRPAYESLGMVLSHFPQAGYVEHRDKKGHFYYDIQDLKESSDEDSYAMSSIVGLVKLGVFKQVQIANYDAYIMTDIGMAVLRDAIEAGEVHDMSD
ncbi:hypothetical protein [Vibrio mediterranei]|uniref:hypothetical protein n=1 Tax=Vibrio mediterranei TaxID=689 RepID=UPI00406805A9